MKCKINTKLMNNENLLNNVNYNIFGNYGQLQNHLSCLAFDQLILSQHYTKYIASCDFTVSCYCIL